MDSLDVDDICKSSITNLKTHFCLWRNHTNAHNPQKLFCSNKLPRNGNSKAKKINIKQFSL